MILKLRILRSLTRLFIILISPTRSLFSGKMLISKRCSSGLMSNLIKKFLTDPYLEWLELSLWDVQVVVLYGLVFSELVGGMDLANKIFVNNIIIPEPLWLADITTTEFRLLCTWIEKLAVASQSEKTGRSRKRAKFVIQRESSAPYVQNPRTLRSLLN